LGQRIAMLRARRQLKQKELADLAGLSVSFLSDVENDKRTISSDGLLRLADVLGANLDYLLRGGRPATDPVPMAIPAALASAAESQNWSFAVASDLLRAQSIVVGRRTLSGKVGKQLEDWTEDDWIRLYLSLFSHDAAP
jgi:transcriptional regulator with XRE-family HTH domain